jgi:hypothetical protein
MSAFQLSTIDLTWTDMLSNPGLHSEKSETKRLRKPKYSEKNMLQYHSSTTDFTRTDLLPHPGLRSENSAINCLSQGRPLFGREHQKISLTSWKFRGSHRANAPKFFCCCYIPRIVTILPNRTAKQLDGHSHHLPGTSVAFGWRHWAGEALAKHKATCVWKQRPNEVKRAS